jgi:hypothetical protein
MTTPGRLLAAALEPVVGAVFFAPECHAAYEALGFGPSPKQRDGVAQPDISAYFTSRVACMGRVRGQVAVAAFGVFEPSIVIAGIELGWRLTDPDTIARIRVECAATALERLLGPADGQVEEIADLLGSVSGRLELPGRPLAAGLVALGPQGPGWMRLHWAADVLREYRGDSHNAAWLAAGLTAPEICLLGDPYRGLPARTYSRSRGWSHEALDVAEARLRSLGWWDDSGITREGWSLRESIEEATDLQMRSVLEDLGSNIEDLITQLGAWASVIVEGGGYPANSPLFRSA